MEIRLGCNPTTQKDPLLVANLYSFVALLSIDAVIPSRLLSGGRAQGAVQVKTSFIPWTVRNVTLLKTVKTKCPCSMSPST